MIKYIKTRDGLYGPIDVFIDYRPAFKAYLENVITNDIDDEEVIVPRQTITV